MKALIISDKQEIIDFSGKFLCENGYDIIVYRWLLKAIDNIEEIQPDLIILSAAEYPRHWKTLASFVKSGIGGKNVQIYLYDPDSLNDEEKRKAVELGIKDYITTLNTKSFEKIIPSNKTQKLSLQNENPISTYNWISNDEESDNFIKKNNDETKIIADKVVPSSKAREDNCKIIFTNPISKKFIFGIAVFDASSGFFSCNFNDFSDLCIGMIIKYVSVYDLNKQISVFSAKIIEIEEGDYESTKEKSIKLEPMEYYEKN